MKDNHIDFVTLGCSKNLVDTEGLMRQFQALGYTVSHDAETPTGTIVVVNTCGFIGDAKEESIDTILAYCAQKKAGKLKRLYVMGCLSQRYRDDLTNEIPEVDKFYGKFDYNQLLEELGSTYDTSIQHQRNLTTPDHYAYVKIAEGCNQHCSYCAIPMITGAYRSKTIEVIVEEVKWLVARGVKEFQLIAQDLTYYGKDIYGAFRLADLVRAISDVEGVEWIRLHYAYPTRFPFDVLDVMRERENVCNYLDLAFQHIADPMLARMHRGITSEQTYELLAKIREMVPGIQLRTTLMVGHSGETEEEFLALMEFVKKARFERMGAFSYSDEDGTYSNIHYNDDVSPELKQQRLDELMGLQQSISLSINQAQIGQERKVIIDRLEGGYYIGRTEFDSPDVDMEVLISSEENSLSIGEFYQVELLKAEDFDFYAQIKK